EEVADTSATGICTRPKLIAPFQIALGMALLLTAWVTGDCCFSTKVSVTGEPCRVKVTWASGWAWDGEPGVDPPGSGCRKSLLMSMRRLGLTASGRLGSVNFSTPFL